MKKIDRDIYLKRLINRRENGLIKILTGIRRCGKSYLLDPIFTDYLIETGVKKDHIIKIELDREKNKKYLTAGVLEEFIRNSIVDDQMYYVILDEIQLVEGFEFILNGFLYEKNIDVYVTGSNSKFLSSDLITEFRGRGDQIKVYPFSFSEFLIASNKDKYDAWNEYVAYGGIPLVVSKKSDEEKAEYLKNLMSQTYITDIVERNNIKRVDVMDSIINILASSVGSLTNPQKLLNSFKSTGEKELSINTITSQLNFIEDSFIINKSLRYNVKGKKYINTPFKYYFTDVGLRNARLNFRQQEENHIMENIIYNELLVRGYNVDVGIVEVKENNIQKQLEVDFICNLGSKRYYIQSALNIDTQEKRLQESKSLNNINDNFKKIIIVKDNIKLWRTEDGITVMSVFDFLLNNNSLDL